MFQSISHPSDNIRWIVEAKVNDYRQELSDLSDEELSRICVEGRKAYREFKGDPAWKLMGMLDQPDELYRGIAASRTLIKRHNENYVRDLFKTAKVLRMSELKTKEGVKAKKRTQSYFKPLLGFVSVLLLSWQISIIYRLKRNNVILSYENKVQQEHIDSSLVTVERSDSDRKNKLEKIIGINDKPYLLREVDGEPAISDFVVERYDEHYVIIPKD